MDTIEFSKNIPAKTLAEIFKSFFEQHICAYYLLSKLNFVSINADMDRSSIIYSVKLLDPNQLNYILDTLKKESTSINIYGKIIKPEVFTNGDLLCLSFKS